MSVDYNHDNSNTIELIEKNRTWSVIATIVSTIALLLAILAVSPIQVMFPQNTGSMEPLLDGDELVIVDTHVHADKLSNGDLIVFDSYCKSDTDLLIHKVVSNGDDGVYTKGTSAPVIDQESPCRPDITDQSLIGEAKIVIDDIAVF